jgi:hypothetical protein
MSCPSGTGGGNRASFARQIELQRSWQRLGREVCHQ